MRILVVPEFSCTGGTRTYLKNLISYLREREFQFVIAVNKGQLDNEIKSFLSLNNVEIILIPERHPFFYRLPFNLFFDVSLFIYLRFKTRPNFVIVSVASQIWMGVLIFTTPLFYVIHSYPMRYNKKFGFLIRTLFNKYLSSNRQIVTVSEFSKQNILKYYQILPEYFENVKVIYNAVKDHFENIGHKRKIVLTLGHLVHYKNPYLFIDVAKEITILHKNDPPEFIWAGDGPLLSSCIALTKDFSNIKFLGNVNETGLLFSNSLIYFQPSEKESHGISVLEAMMHGLPCVVSNVGGLPESVVDGISGFTVDPFHKFGFVEKILALLDSSDLREKMGAEGRRIYLKKFAEIHWVEEMDKLLKLKR